MKRILLKLSGEALAGAAKRGFDEETVIAVAKQIRTIAEEGTQVGIVIGGVLARQSTATKRIRLECLLRL